MKHLKDDKAVLAAYMTPESVVIHYDSKWQLWADRGLWMILGAVMASLLMFSNQAMM